MTREEAIKIVRNIYQTDAEKEALAVLVPELKESEGEKIRKAALEGIEYLERKLGWDFIGDTDILDVKEYLEKRETVKKIRYELDAPLSQDINGRPIYLEDLQNSADNTYPPSLEEAVRLYYDTYGNGKGGFDYISLPKFQDIVETFVKDYGQKPAKWSEEDTKMLEATIAFVKHCPFSTIGKGKNNVLAWLKALRLHPYTEYERGVKDGIQNKKNHQWKPSEEQMKALNEIINTLATSKYPHENDYLFNVLNGLRKGLKKLEL